MNPHPYSSDRTDGQWAILGPLITPGAQAGHPQVFEMRRIVDAVFYVLRPAANGGRWRVTQALPDKQDLDGEVNRKRPAVI